MNGSLAADLDVSKERSSAEKTVHPDTHRPAGLRAAVIVYNSRDGSFARAETHKDDDASCSVLVAPEPVPAVPP